MKKLANILLAVAVIAGIVAFVSLVIGAHIPMLVGGAICVCAFFPYMDIRGSKGGRR